VQPKVQRKVVVTALNLVTALGVDLESSWDGLVAGRSGIRKISLFDTTKHETRIAGEVPGEFDDYARKHCSRRLSNQMGRAIKMGYVCAKEAVGRARLDFDAYDRVRCATIFGGAGNCSGVRQWTSPIAVKGRIVVGGDGHLCSWSPH